MRRTEHKLLRRGQHIQRKGDLVLVPLALQPAQEVCWVERGCEKEGCGSGKEAACDKRGEVEHCEDLTVTCWFFPCLVVRGGCMRVCELDWIALKGYERR